MSSKPLNPHFPSDAPPEASATLVRLAQLVRWPVDRFLRVEASGGLVLLAAAVVALLWANSRWSPLYLQLWETPLAIQIGPWSVARSLGWFVNDVLMVVFFFVIGMEIRRELHQGALSELRRAALPAVAALGGMFAPAGIYLLIVSASEARVGWGVPMATDIAFAVGVLTLLGKRVPPALRILLLALAVIDDVGAIVIIALFYSSALAWSGLAIVLGGVASIVLLQRFGLRNKLAYVVPGFFVWLGFYIAGIHPTIAGVVIGLLTPVRAWLGTDGFIEGVRGELDQLGTLGQHTATPEEVATILKHVDEARRETLSPLDSLVDILHPWVAFGIMPLFALANAGVLIEHFSLGAPARIPIAVAVALVVGKPVGVLFATWVATRLRIAALPPGLRLRDLLLLGTVAGIGFTMSIFTAQLAFRNAELLAAAKVGILLGSALAIVASLVIGWIALRPVAESRPVPAAPEADVPSTEQAAADPEPLPASSA